MSKIPQLISAKSVLTTVRHVSSQTQHVLHAIQTRNSNTFISRTAINSAQLMSAFLCPTFNAVIAIPAVRPAQNFRTNAHHACLT
jgi:hypothetical protein